MKYNSEFDLSVEQMDFNTDGEDAGHAGRRMALICAEGIEQQTYKYNPNAARNNRRPAQPLPIGENGTTDYSD